MKKMFLVVLFFLLLTSPVFAMTADGCGAGSCTDCHSLAKSEAGELLKGLVDKVNNVEFSEVPGLWMIEAEKNRIKVPVYLDFSKSFVIAGEIIRLGDRENITRQQFLDLNPVNFSEIPLDDALVLGSPEAKIKAVVFTDPECPYCRELHHELKEIVRQRKDIAFYIKLFPLPIHPNAYPTAKAIVCAKSLDLLEDSYNKKSVAPAACETTAIDQNIALAQKLGIRSTPTLILPNGRILPGMKKADALIPLLEAAAQ